MRALSPIPILLLASLSSCSAPLDVELIFLWPEAPQSHERPVWITARIEQRLDARVATGVTLTSAGPVKYREGFDLRMDRVPYGRDRVVIIEVRRDDSPSSEIAFFGVSERFNLAPDLDRQRVPVKIEIHRVGPDPNRTAAAPMIVLERAPWGTHLQPAPYARVLAAETAVLPETLVLALDPATGVELGRTRSAANGAFELELRGIAGPEVDLKTIDPLGTESELLRVRDGRWTASLIGKIPGHDFPNPNRLASTSRALLSLGSRQGPGAEPEPENINAVLSRDGSLFEAETAHAWHQKRRSAGAPPAQRDSLIFAYDSARARLILFDAPSMERWEWDGESWPVVADRPDSAPRQGSSWAAAYDTTRARVVVVGGVSCEAGSTTTLETWEWDGDNWIDRTAPGAPPARCGQAMAYDFYQQKIVLFGGKVGSAWLNDLWEWDGESWRERGAQGAGTWPKSSSPRMASAPSRGVLLFGWEDSEDSPGIFWWDGRGWRRILDPPVPLAGEVHLTFETRKNLTVLAVETEQNRTDLFSWDGRDWSEGPWIIGVPASLWDLYSDDEREALSLIGQDVDAVQIYEISGRQWTKHPTEACSAANLPRTIPDAADTNIAGDTFSFLPFDTTRERAIFVQNNQTWEWTGSTWIQAINHNIDSPAVLSGHTMTFDPLRNRTFLFGGVDEHGIVRGEGWAWDGSAWTAIAVPEGAPAPGPRRSAASTYDERGGSILLFGGFNEQGALSDTWTWNGSAWIEHRLGGASSPQTRSGQRLVSIKRQPVLIQPSTSDAPGEMWAWEDNSWSKIPEIDVPALDGDMLAAFDVSSQRTILAALEASTQTIAVWTRVEGEAWRRESIAPSSQPSISGGVAAYYHPRSAKLVVFPSPWSASCYPLTLDLTPTLQTPAIHFDVPLDTAAIRTSEITELALNVTAGGRNHDAEQNRIPGWRALGWNAAESRWIEWCRGEADLARPETKACAVGLSEEVQRYAQGDGRIHVRLEPLTGDAHDIPARVGVDHLELTINYRKSD